jgi:AcrR family transcriptional regulator
MTTSGADLPKVEPRGRPRSTESERAILKATLALLRKQSLRQISIEAIAKRANVGKNTIYKWWPSKAAVALNAFGAAMVDNVLISSEIVPTFTENCLRHE